MTARVWLHCCNRQNLLPPERDAKLAELRQRIERKLQQPTVTNDQHKNHKVLVFTAYADTARYLYEQLQPHIVRQGHHVALVHGGDDNRVSSGDSSAYDNILPTLAPCQKTGQRQAKETAVDVLIAHRLYCRRSKPAGL